MLRAPCYEIVDQGYKFCIGIYIASMRKYGLVFLDFVEDCLIADYIKAIHNMLNLTNSRRFSIS